jgi:hypothetical protein
MTQNKQSKRIRQEEYLLTGSLIIAFMLFIPYAFYLYTYFPEDKIFETRFFTFESKGYEDVRYFAWLLFSKLVPLSLLLIWFTTSKNWWYYSIAIPISVYVSQVAGILNDDLRYFDEVDYIYTLPITLVILTILFFIRSKIGVYLKAKSIKKEMDEVMDRSFVKKE